MPRRKAVKKKKPRYSGFDEPHSDTRCDAKKWGDRLALYSDLESVALKAIGEHMTVDAWKHACMTAWNKSVDRISDMDECEPGDPPSSPPVPPTSAN